MNRPFHTWLTFGVCLAVLLGTLGWISLTTLRLDRAQTLAAIEAEKEEKVRLALWRLDSWMLPMFIEESARPSRAYQSFYGAQQAFSRGAKGGYASLKPGDVLLPSPLLAYDSPNILLHFQFAPGGPVVSPQVPEQSLRALAVANYINEDLLRLREERLETLRRFLLEPAPVMAAAGLRTNPPAPGWLGSSLRSPPVQLAQAVNYWNNGDVIFNEAPKQLPEELPLVNWNPNLALNSPAQPPAQMAQTGGQQEQQLRNTMELNVRDNFYQRAQSKVLENRKNDLQAQQEDLGIAAAQPVLPPGAAANTGPLEGLFRAVWVGDEMFLVRRVMHDGAESVQGCWLNWTNLKASLLETVRDLLPEARLLPRSTPTGDASARILASIPVKLMPGPAGDAALPLWTPVRISLAVAWGGILLAALAAGLLLHGLVSLSERRAAFVSSVTHELRTPLTTFKMYSEMLAEGMVRDEDRRREYLNTLCSEANRLSHLVENVLAYARLERGSARRQVEKVTLREIIRRVEPRLSQRAGQAGLQLAVDADEHALATSVHVDVSAVEQILFNLVDNACKYAAPDSVEKLIHLEALTPEGNGRHAMLRVRDHGQGISAEGARRLFTPFCKSAHEAAHSAPGVGLGLALCRRLSRSLGGDLRWVSGVKNGACFELRLPRAQAG